MEAILKHVNEKLKKHNLQIIEKDVLNEHQMVIEAWKKVSESIAKPVKFLIVGEATTSWDNYFYNPDAKTTNFLSPSHFGFKGKNELIRFFKQKGVLVFDLYPLPLPTFIYDNIKFDSEFNSPYVDALIKYYEESLIDNRIINSETVIVSRYAKFYKEKKDKNNQVIKNKSGNVVLDEKRFEWEVFMKIMNRKVFDFKHIFGGYSAEANKVEDVFKNILKK
jgi:hypothetical protein